MEQEDTTNQRTLSRKYESLDYDLIENVIHLEHQHKSRLNTILTRDLQRWLAIFIIGFATALSGFFAGFVVNYLTRIKFTHIIQLSEQICPKQEDSPTIIHNIKCMLIPYSVWLAWNILPSLFGSLLVTYVAPIAAGSGIPVVKCYLNGVRIPEVVRFKTYVTKLLGVISSVVGGLAVGKEGPFIHCGAALGAGLSQGKCTSMKFDTKLFKSFRNDRDKRDFVSAGASAGVAAAFGAPIGGVLFALEEGASFWNQALTWRIFFCSMMTSFILNLFMSAYNNNAGVLAFYSLVNFGLVEELDYFWFEIPVYILIAMLGGIIGASFCKMNLLITKFRKRYISQNWMKVLEVVLVAILTATAGTLLILFASDCRKIPPSTPDNNTPTNFTYSFHKNIDNNNNLDKTSQSSISLLNIYHPAKFWTKKMDKTDKHLMTYNSDNEMRKATEGHRLTFMCPPGEYSEMSSLWLKTSEGASSTFMVLQEDIWSIKTLSLFLLVYYVLATITYGLSISSGVFIPSLLIGATMGRLIGLILRHYLGPLEWLIQLNKFAIIGAASVLGGVVRMTISLTVIIIEATGCISFGLPIMICLMVSKWVADSSIEGLYDLAIHMANVPFLDWEPPMKSYSIYASDAMAPNVKVLRTTETVSSIIHILQTTTHNGFPVVDLDDSNSIIDYDKYNNAKYFNKAASSSSTISSTNIQQQQQQLNKRSITNNQQQDPMSPSTYYTPEQSPANNRLRNLFGGPSGDSHNLINVDSVDETNEDFLIGSFQRCSITAKRESYGRFRGLILRWQLLVMLDLKIFNENERSFEQLCLPSFQKQYPRYPTLDKVIKGLSEEMMNYHVDLRSIMNPTSYTVLYSASFPRIYKLFRSLGLRHLVVIDDRNQVVGMITRKDLARYVRERDRNGVFKFQELRYSS